MTIMKILEACNLENCRFSTSHRVDKNKAKDLFISLEEMNYRVIQVAIARLSNKILLEKQSTFTKQEFEYFIQYKCELFILERKDLMSIIDTAIQQMPFELIQQIKNKIPLNPELNEII